METNNKTFKPYDKIILREKDFGNDNDRTWRCAFYSHSKENYICTTESIMFNEDNIDILPYKGNEHLVGTTNEPEEVIKLEGEKYLFVSDSLTLEEFVLRQFATVNLVADKFMVYSIFAGRIIPYKYAIKLSDFDSNNIENVMDKVLEVKNGKVIRYKKQDENRTNN